MRVNIGVVISLGDMEPALDYLNDKNRENKDKR